jgi:hypothetical protein
MFTRVHCFLYYFLYPARLNTHRQNKLLGGKMLCPWIFDQREIKVKDNEFAVCTPFVYLCYRVKGFIPTKTIAW